MKTINELQDEVIEEFSDFDDWMDKYQLLIEQSLHFPFRIKQKEHLMKLP